MLELGIVKRPIAYFGDGEGDVPAFCIADISVWVVHEENKGLDLGARYRVTYSELARHYVAQFENLSLLLKLNSPSPRFASGSGNEQPRHFL